jgi:hypothetical protein
MKPDFEWQVRRRLSADAEKDLARRFAAGSPAYFLLLIAFAYGTSSWSAHPVSIAVFAGLFAVAAQWHQIISKQMAEHYDDCPAFWRASVRRAAYASAALWAVFTAWTGLNVNHEVFLLALVTAGVAVTINVSLRADEILTERCLLIVLTPVLCVELANGALAPAVMTAFLLTTLIALGRTQSIRYWDKVVERAELELRVEKAERTLAMVVEAYTQTAPVETSPATAQDSEAVRVKDLVLVSR